MTIAMNILLGLIATYFLMAAFIPKLRVRWGVAKGIGWTWSKSGVQRKAYSRRQPCMGIISCLGFATFFGGFLFAPYFGCIAGLILLAIGAILDWLREPPVQREKDYDPS